MTKDLFYVKHNCINLISPSPLLHYLQYSNSVWFRIICVIFMQQILFQGVDTFSNTIHKYLCCISVWDDWFPFTEQHLKRDKLLNDNNRILFNTHPYYGGGIEDDHIPFLHRSKSSTVFSDSTTFSKNSAYFYPFFLIHLPLYYNNMLKRQYCSIFYSYFAFLHVCTFLFLWRRCSHPPSNIGTISQCLAQNEWRCRPHRLSHDRRLQQGLPIVCCQLSTPRCLT